MANKLNEVAVNGRQKALDKIINLFITKPQSIRAYVNKLRFQNANINKDNLAKKIVNRKSFKSGLVGAATGIGGLITLPVAIPADLIASWKLQITMALAVAYVYEHNQDTTDLKTDIYLILAGNSAKEALKRFSIETGKAITKKTISKYINIGVMKKIWTIVGRKIITKAGQKSITSFTKLVPLVGAPIGFLFDWLSTKAVGKIAIKYYRG